MRRRCISYNSGRERNASRAQKARGKETEARSPTWGRSLFIPPGHNIPTGRFVNFNEPFVSLTCNKKSEEAIDYYTRLVKVNAWLPNANTRVCMHADTRACITADDGSLHFTLRCSGNVGQSRVSFVVRSPDNRAKVYARYCLRAQNRESRSQCKTRYSRFRKIAGFRRGIGK